MNDFNNTLQWRNNKYSNFNVFKRKRPTENDINSEYLASFKRMKLIEDFEKLSLDNRSPSDTKTSFNISINMPDKKPVSFLHREIQQSLRDQYTTTPRNWEVGLLVNWKVFWHFIFLHNTNPRKKHIKIKNILWWLTQVGIPQGLDVWNYYYFDSYEKRAKKYYKVPEDVEMEL